MSIWIERFGWFGSRLVLVLEGRFGTVRGGGESRDTGCRYFLPPHFKLPRIGLSLGFSPPITCHWTPVVAAGLDSAAAFEMA